MENRKNKSTFITILSLLLMVYGCSTTKKVATSDDSGRPKNENATNGNELSFTLNSDSDTKKAGSLQSIHFAYNSSGIDNESESILLANAEILRKYPNLKIQIEGHCDERGSTQFNLALGENRAKEVESFFFGQRISVDRMSIISLGKEHPISFGHYEESWKDNRRANFVIIGK